MIYRERARKEILRTNLADRVKIVHADMFDVDVGEATVVSLIGRGVSISG